MSVALPSPVEHVADVELLRGPRTDPSAPPDLLIEVPHGADERGHYDRLRSRLTGDLPADLHEFFHVNTDVAAWALGRATALALIDAAPQRSVLLVRCLIPRTFVDCNRVADYRGGPLDAGALTPGIPSYVRDPNDRALLLDLHGRYVELARQAFAAVCGAGGLALVPHTYGPRSLGIDAVDDDIVTNLRWACDPERHDSWPLRAEVDLLTRDGEGQLFAPAGIEAELMDALTGAGFTPKANDTYFLHPSTLGHAWSVAYPGRVLSLELRRDLLVEAWRPLEPMQAVPAACERVAKLLAPALERALTRR
ncbi:hypothetical protein DB30_01445 [Enhygromyxa salina]|uniref:N-formylglutamate amidohydrolase n=1 Tax=Enhygromyxa salina TaxID=215803 RepID=A0A0C1ZMZ1_9BACT|nr:hypothetical protein [Enhygromyxa salina]KIG12453.1 hypothetical protein DB30_01445 [Enhygromyxa salina]